MKSFSNISLWLLSMLFCVAEVYAQQVGINTVTVRFDQPPTTYSVEKAPLRYNKDFAFGMHIDDNSKDIYTHAFPLLNGGSISGVNYPGLYYTDGCGNDIAFKMSVSVFSFEQGGTVDGHDPNGPYADLNVTWPELIELYQNEWGVYNHGLTSSNALDPYYSIRRNHSYVKRKMLDATPGGPEMKVFVNPNGDETFTTPAFNEDYIVAYRQYSFGVPSFDVTIFDVGDSLRMGRTTMEGSTNMVNVVNSIANASVNEAHHFGSGYNHSITGGAGYSFPVFRAYMNSIANTYGKNGLDNIWMTTEEEILEYLNVNEDITLNNQLIGTDLIIEFSGTLRTDFRYYATSLVVEADQLIDTVFIDGGNGHTLTGLGTQNALINLEWDGYVQVADTVNAETYVSIAEQTEEQYDWNIAMDYVEMLEPGPTKEAFRDRLCAIPGPAPPAGYCNCTTSLGPDTTICEGDCITLTAEDGGQIYAWNTGDSTQSIFVCPDSTTTYSVTVYNSVMCPATDSIVVNVAPYPTANAGNDTTICSGQCIDLTATGGATYIWSTGDTAQTITVCPEDTTQYFVDVISQYNCISEDSVTVFVIESPIANAGNDTSICLNDCAILTASGGIEYLWSTGDTLSTIEVCPEDTTTYNVTVTAENGCSDADSVAVFVLPLPVPEAGNDTTICQGDSAYLTASGGVHYAWSTGDTTQTIAVSPQDTSIYYVEVFNDYECSAEDSVQVNILPSPQITADSDTLICEGDCATLHVTGSGEILWSTGDTTSSVTVCPESSTDYWVQVTNNLGCSGSDTVSVNISPPPVPDAGNDTTICRNSCIDLVASGGTTYIWSTGDTAQQIEVCPMGDTMFYVTVYNEIGCFASDSIAISTIPSPVLTVSPDTGLCIGGCVNLTVEGAESYYWNTGDTSSTILVCPENTTHYWVEGTGSNQCTTSDSVQVEIYPNPNADAGDDTTFCLGYPVTLTATGGAYYLWNNEDTNQSISVHPYEATTYYVQVFSEEGCESRDSVRVTPKQTPEVFMWGLDPAYCETDEMRTLYGQPGGGIFEGDGVVDNTFDPALAGGGTHLVTYSFEGVNGCVGRDSIYVSIYPVPDVDLGPDTSICNTDYINLDAGPGFDTYLWMDGSIGQVASFYGEDLGIGVETISVIVTLDGCINRGEKVVEVTVCNPGIQEYGDVPDINVFPNPSNGIVNIVIGDYQEKVNLKVMSVEGIVQLKQEDILFNHRSHREIDLNHLVSGIYILNIYNDDFLYKISLVIK
ncbi:MAG: T9SS type A sorting domain-containing protein [Bacteroidales bacterium]|nr:T9SS type A sorting domain-containing protein [Bacteroidales bacterium]